jgi:CHASE3 domain sensor protein
MFVYFLLNGDYDGNLLLIFVILISFLILTFTSLVYNEILVINLWGLQDYTQHGLDIQAEKDLRDAVTEISELSSDVSEVSNSKSESFIIKNVSYAD